MRDRLKACGGLATHPLCWRIRRDELGIGGFQGLELVIQGIVFGVANARTVLDIILMLMQMNRLTQLVQALCDHSEVFHRVSLERAGINTGGTPVYRMSLAGRVIRPDGGSYAGQSGVFPPTPAARTPSRR